MGYFVILGVAAGFIAGTAVGVWSSRKIIVALSRRSARSRSITIGTYSGLFLAILPAAFLSITVGGNLAGAWASVLSVRMGLGSIGAPLGLLVGISLVLSVLLASGALLGGLLGATLTSAVRRS